MNFKKRVNGSWTDTSHYIHNTSTDTITTLPADIYPTGTTAMVGLKGQTVQSSTPSPTSPVMPQGTGERTGNLFDGDYAVAVMSVSGNTATLNTASSGRTAIVKCEPNTTYTVKKHGVSNRFIIVECDIKPVNGTAMAIIQNNSSISEYSFTTSNTAQYVAIYCSTSSEQAEPPLMLNTGSTALPYEPYGIKIPISSASTTTPVYLGEVQTARKIKKIVFVGSEDENWSAQGAGSGALRFRYTLSNSIQADTAYLTSICTHLPLGVEGSTWNTDNIFTISSNYLWIRLDSSITTVASLKSWLAQQYANGTPFTVFYTLATPETGIVNEPLMRIGDYADTVSGITIPTITGADSFDVLTTLKPSEVELTYTGWHDATVEEWDGSQWQ